LLESRTAQPDNVEIAVHSALTRDHVTARGGFLTQSVFSRTDVGEAVDRLAGTGKVKVRGELVLDAAWWATVLGDAVTAIDAHHREHPEHPGLPLNQLRAALEKQVGTPSLFDVLVADLREAGFIQLDTTIKRATHRPALPPHLQAAGAALRKVLAAKPLDPPSRKELAPTPVTQQALRFLVQTGEAVELSADVVLSAESYQKAVDQIRTHLSEHRSATVSELRQLLGASRRIVVPLLEKLDREAVTRREGDLRVLR
jgi:selenocysteine-specific elongation factor